MLSSHLYSVSRYRHEPLGSIVYRENTSDTWNNPRYTTWKRCIIMLQDETENTVANNINTTNTRGERREGWM